MYDMIMNEDGEEEEEEDLLGEEKGQPRGEERAGRRDPGPGGEGERLAASPFAHHQTRGERNIGGPAEYCYHPDEEEVLPDEVLPENEELIEDEDEEEDDIKL